MFFLSPGWIQFWIRSYCGSFESSDQYSFSSPVLKFLLRFGQVLGIVLFGAAVFWLLFRHPTEEAAGGKIRLTAKGPSVGMWPAGMANGAALGEFQKIHPEVRIAPWTSFKIPGDLSIASELMSFAAKSAPDITFTYVHRLQFYIEQGFYKRLNSFIGEDENGNGILDEAEIRWKPWLTIPPLFRQMGMRGTDIYALPIGTAFSTIVFRPDIFAAAGLDPKAFPKDFPEFFKAGQKICAYSLRNPGQHRVYAMSRELQGLYQSLLWSAGGNPGQGEVRDQAGKVVLKLTPDDNPTEQIRALGLEPSKMTITWKAVFDDKPSQEALEAIWKMCWQPWILNPLTDEPLNLTKEQVEQGRVIFPDGKILALATDVPGGVQHGICRPARAVEALGESDADLLQEGDLAMLMLQNNNYDKLSAQIGRYAFALPPTLHRGGTPAVIALPMLYGLNAELQGKRLDAAWDFLSFYAGPEWKRITVHNLMEQGHASAVSPLDAIQLGMEDVLAKLSPSWVEVNRQAMKVAHTIPFFSGYQQAETEFFARTVNRIVSNSDVDIPEALRETQFDVDHRILRPADVDQGWLPTLFAGGLVGLSLMAIFWGIRSVTRDPRLAGGGKRPATANPPVRFTFWLLVLPAILSVLVWSYYPVFRGSLLAFQDYHLTGTSHWVGLSNFVDGVWSLRFWFTIWNSILFIILNVGLGFFAPIFLAVLLDEIPRAKYFFRTVFFLPSVTSGLVIMLLWMTMYEPSGEGLFNQVLHPLIQFWNHWLPAALAVDWPIRWLNDPRLAMICVVIPSIWAAMGSGCLIYLAALQSVSPDLYESAEIDGAGFTKKLLHVTLPYLRPLLIINLIGVFIGSAHGWSHIFVMTGGGPDLATQVAALEIWANSFVFLRFGMATAQAWVLASLLIGFTVWQIKQMQKVDFRRPDNS